VDILIEAQYVVLFGVIIGVAIAWYISRIRPANYYITELKLERRGIELNRDIDEWIEDNGFPECIITCTIKTPKEVIRFLRQDSGNVLNRLREPIAFTNEDGSPYVSYLKHHVDQERDELTP